MNALLISEPAWILALREQVAAKGQRAVAKEIGYSPAVVSQVLNAKYGGDMAQVEKRVRGAYMGETVFCPVLGEIPSNQCLDHQRKPFAPINPMRVRLYRACRAGCENSKLEGRRS
jgi:hypothetical protein